MVIKSTEFMSKKYGIIHNLKNGKGLNRIALFFEWMNNRGYSFCFNKEIEEFKRYNIDVYDNKEVIRQSDIIIVFGGDGSMLGVARTIGELKKPILGVNFGKLGFLADVDIDELYDRIELIEKCEYTIQMRNLLSCTYKDNSFHALNDIVIDKGYSPRLMKVDVDINGKFFNTYTSDGLIVATPTGSTAYNLSASGPIVEPSMDAFVITPINPHALAMRPVIIHYTSKIRITVDGTEGMILIGDGQNSFKLSSGEEVLISKADFQAHFIKFADSSYYKLLREKLGWGGFKTRNN